MKQLLPALFLILMMYNLQGQDTTAVLPNKFFQPSKQQTFITVDNITIATYNLQLSVMEREMAELESRESQAVLKRDTAELIKLWARDFTLDEASDKLVNGKNPLPYYASFSRLIERCTPVGNDVYTSGYEMVQLLPTNGPMKDPVKRTFFHAWTRKNGQWKLITRTND